MAGWLRGSVWAVCGSAAALVLSCSTGADRAGDPPAATKTQAAGAGVVVWEQKFPPTTPAAREGHGLVFDWKTNQVLLFGGRDGSTYYNDTWLYDGNDWTKLSPASSPSPRAHFAMASDNDSRHVVLFGGRDASGALGDTWEWDGATWSQKCTSGCTPPSARTDAAMSDGNAYGQLVLFGGVDASFTDLADTWLWNGTSWAQQSGGVAPAACLGAAMVHDTYANQVVLFGGQSGATYLDQFFWDTTYWTDKSTVARPGGREGFGMVFDHAVRQVILFGGYPLNVGAETWTASGTTWTQVTPAPSPSARFATGMAFDGARFRTVLFGGQAGGTTFSDTWELYQRGESCATDTDCETQHCVDGACCETAACGTCQTCNDATTPGVCTALVSAEDPDSCSGTRACDATGACRAKQGQACNAGGDCLSGFCVDGVCCGSACTAACQACTQALTGKPDGTCDQAKAGTDPHSDCPDPAPDSCGPDGMCDGSSGCRAYAPAGSSCGTNTCTGGLQSGQQCDGAGKCQLVNGTSCGAYTCDATGTTCLQTCTQSGGCASGYFCDQGACTPLKGAGAACTQGSECSTKYCADGVCCDSACNGQCEACAEPGNPGACVPVSGDPRSGHVPCDGAGTPCAGTCNGVDRSACSYPGTDQACGTPSCQNGVAKSSTCNGKGVCVAAADTQCAPYVCGADACNTSCQGDSECATGYRCRNGTCEVAPGAKCSDDLTSSIGADGTTPCSPYICDVATGGCMTSCTGSNACASGFVCDPTAKTCVTASTGDSSSDSGGCGCATPRRSRGAPGALALALLLLARRRRTRAAARRTGKPDLDQKAL